MLTWGPMIIWMLTAFHLNGMLALYDASTITLSPTLGIEPFTQLHTNTNLILTYSPFPYVYQSLHHQSFECQLLSVEIVWCL